MARPIKDMVAQMIYEVPKRPKSQVFTYRHVLDEFELREIRHRPNYVSHLKRRMANELADHIVKECQLFQMFDMADLYRGVPIQMELTINDRGSYENFLPIVKHEARKEGVRVGSDAVKRTIPYGFEPEQYYE